MELSKLLGDELYAQVQAKIDETNASVTDKTKHVRFVDLSEGGYVSKAKFDDKTGTLSQQVTDLQGQITQRDTDLKDLQDKLASAQADAGKLGDVQSAFTNLQSKYNSDRQAWEQKHQKQIYEFMVRERTNSLNFSSPAAKRDFIREANEKEFKVDGDVLMGYEDFLTKYKAENPGALVDPAPADNGGDGADGASAKQPTIVLPNNLPTPTEKDAFGFHFNGVRPKPSDER